MTRWIVSLAALILVASAFANPSSNNYTNLGNKGWDNSSNHDGKDNSYCDPTPKDCDPKPPTNCVPEPTSMAALAVGGVALLRRKKKPQA